MEEIDKKLNIDYTDIDLIDISDLKIDIDLDSIPTIDLEAIDQILDTKNIQQTTKEVKDNDRVG